MRSWTKVRTTHYSAGIYDPNLPVAVFDFDSTLRPYRGRGPPTDLTSRFLAGIVPCFNIVIVSNRSSANNSALAPIREYVGVLDSLMADSVVFVYCPTARDRDRKPHTGTWEHFVQDKTPSFAFYCGDAAGRPGDHSAADYMYALNNKFDNFITPEALFYGSTSPWVDPVSLGCNGGGLAATPPADALAAERAMFELLQPRGQTVVILVGSPASGKSRIAGQLAGFTLVSRDVHGTRQFAHFLSALSRGESVVVDNTNPRASDRAKFIAAAQQSNAANTSNAAIVICNVTTPKETCFHLNAARCQLSERLELPPVVLHTWWKRYEPPTVEEAPTIITVPFVLAPDAPAEVASFHYPLR
jgi:bifunctional polynucleotide phosphatase/kinase